MINLKDKKILITGATGGIGKALVKKFLSLDGNKKTLEVETFTWEKLDMVDKIKKLIK